MVHINFKPTEKTLTEIVEYLECVEVLDATEKNFYFDRSKKKSGWSGKVSLRSYLDYCREHQKIDTPLWFQSLPLAFTGDICNMYIFISVRLQNNQR